MKTFAVAAVAALALSATSASAADLVTKAPKLAAPPAPPAWDFAFGGAIASDYVWRGVTQSNHKPSVASYFEPRYNINKDVQLYAGIGGASISFPNRAAAEVDIYGGIRPTFDKLSLDIGIWYYWYPGGQCYYTGGAGCLDTLPNGNYVKADFSFWEFYAKANYAVTDAFTVGAYVYYSPSVLNTGADGTFFGGTVKYTFPAMSNGMQWYASGEIGYWDLGTTDSFYGNTPLPSYTTWNLGVGWTWKVFTVDLRYIDTDLSKTECNLFTGDHTANVLGESSWCGARFVARLSADLTVNSNVK
jgi:uncharacterized protein (TIGR02001 family)